MQTRSLLEKIFLLRLNCISLTATLLCKLIGNLIQVADHFKRILDSAHETQGFLFSQGTKKNVRSHIRQFVLFCVYFNRRIVPAERETLVAFFELFFVTANYEHLKNVYSSLKFLHKALNKPFIEDEFQLNTILQSIKRKLAKTPFQVLPITPKILLDLYKFIDINKPSDLALWSCFLVAFYCLFRKANVAPKSFDTFDPTKELSRQKIMILDDETAFVYSSFSKTNQFMNRYAIILLCRHEIRGLDPIFHLKKLFSTSIPPLYPAFSFVENGAIKFVTYSQFTRKLKELLDVAGYSPELFSGHSMRRGGATLLFQLGCDPLLIQAVGDWRSDQFLKYCGLSLEQRFTAQRLMCSQINFGDLGV